MCFQTGVMFLLKLHKKFVHLFSKWVLEYGYMGRARKDACSFCTQVI